VGPLSVVLVEAAELDWIDHDDALEILLLMARDRDPRFDRSAARLGRSASRGAPARAR
jgi:hypothetical protein